MAALSSVVFFLKWGCVCSCVLAVCVLVAVKWRAVRVVVCLIVSFGVCWVWVVGVLLVVCDFWGGGSWRVSVWGLLQLFGFWGWIGRPGVGISGRSLGVFW